MTDAGNFSIFLSDLTPGTCNMILNEKFNLQEHHYRFTQISFMSEILSDTNLIVTSNEC